MSVNDLVHITGWKDFKLNKVEILPDPHKVNARPVSDDAGVPTHVPDATKQVCISYVISIYYIIVILIIS